MEFASQIIHINSNFFQLNSKNVIHLERKISEKFALKTKYEMKSDAGHY